MKIRIDWAAGDQQKTERIFTDTEVKMKKLRGRGGLFERFLAVIPGFIKKNFESRGSRLGFSWAPLSSDYAHVKALKYPGNPILVASGHMRMAATIPNFPGNWVSWTGNVMLYGLDPTKFKAGYPRSHQFGATIPARTIVPRDKKALRFFYQGKWIITKKASPKGGRIPVRPFIGLALEDVSVLGDITREYFRRPE